MSAPAAPAADVEATKTVTEPAPEVPPNPVFFTPEGDLSDKFYHTLRSVFLAYAKIPAAAQGGDDEAKAKVASFDRGAMNAFSKATNGDEIPDEQWDEVIMYLDTNEATELTFKGFVGLYTLQTENDEAETVKDLKKWGYDPETLEKVKKTEKTAVEEGKKEKTEEKAKEEAKEEAK
ncbi:hypothetical protein JCM10449v2_001625 [Rhodotorula kratochvilovae]